MSSHVPYLSMVPGSIYRHLSADYWPGPQLGSGGYGVVRCCQNRTTGEFVACKTIFKERVRLESEQSAVLREIATMRHVSLHEGVVELKEVYEDGEAVHILMEVADRGDLLEFLNKNRDPMSEKSAADIFRQVVKAVSYCHGKGVLHRDLKPENILLFSTRDSVLEEVEKEKEKVQMLSAETGSVEKQGFWELGSPSFSPSPPLSPPPLPSSSFSEITVLPFVEPDMVLIQLEDDSNSVFVPRAVSFSLNEGLSVVPSFQSPPTSPSPSPSSPPPPQSSSFAITGAPICPNNETSLLFNNQSETYFHTKSKFRVKVADFGLAVMSEGEGRHIFAEGRAGSPSYLAPEVAEGRRYGTKADIWSLGVLLHILISREHPFQCSKVSLNSSDSFPDSNKFVYSTELELLSGVWTKCTEELKSLVRWMLTVDSEKKPSAEEVLGHPWMCDVSNIKKYVSDSLHVSVEGGGGDREGAHVSVGQGEGELGGVKGELTFSMWQSSEERSIGGGTDLCSSLAFQSHEKEHGVIDTEEVDRRTLEVEKKRDMIMEVVLGMGNSIELRGVPRDCSSNVVSNYGSLFSSSNDSGRFSATTEKGLKRRQSAVCVNETDIFQDEILELRQLMTMDNCQASERMKVTGCQSVESTVLIEACEEVLGEEDVVMVALNCVDGSLQSSNRQRTVENCEKKDEGETEECRPSLVEAEETNQSNQLPCLEICPSLKRRRITSWQGSVEVNVCG